jgi:hypothetical protein
VYLSLPQIHRGLSWDCSRAPSSGCHWCVKAFICLWVLTSLNGPTDVSGCSEFEHFFQLNAVHSFS